MILCVSGDLWSYDCSSDAYAVSPDPDISMVKINPDKHFCIILASDGFLNMVTAQEAVEMVDALEKETYKRVVYQHVCKVIFNFNNMHV